MITYSQYDRGVSCYIDKGLKAFILNATYLDASQIISNITKSKRIKKQKDIKQCNKRCNVVKGANGDFLQYVVTGVAEAV